MTRVSCWLIEFPTPIMIVGIRAWLDHTPISTIMPMNTLTKPKGMMKLKWMDALKYKLEELKGISDALWESLDC